MSRTLLRSCGVVFVAMLIPAIFVRAADSLDDLEKQLDRVVDLFENDSGRLGSAMLDTAIETLEAAAKEKPDDARAQFLLGRAYTYRGDEKEAAAAYARAAGLAPDNAEYQFLHGTSLAQAIATRPRSGRFRQLLHQLLGEVV